MSTVTVPGISAVTELSAPPPQRRPAEVQGTLALDLVPRQAVPERTALRAVEDSLRERHGELESFVRRFCAGVVDVLAGDRGPTQLLRYVTPPVYERLVQRAHALADAGSADHRLRQVRARMRSMHVCCPTPGVAEFSMHVRHGQRSRAVAGRLELRRGSWTCVALEFC